MKYLSLFSGIGGFELGIKQAYEEVHNKGVGLETIRKTEIQRDMSNPDEFRDRRPEATCIGYSEIDKYAVQVYNKQFNHKNYGDITKIDEKTLPDFDLLVGGFPCQAFSVAGKRKGFEDTRGTLFFEIARIIREKQPRLLLLENVKGLLSHDQGRTFFTIISALNELGYDCQWQVLNSKNFGVPQNRERVFIVGHLRGTPRPEVFPIEEGSGRSDKERLQKQTTPQSVENITDHKNWRRHAVLTPDRKDKRQNGRRFKENGEPSFTLTAGDKHGVYDGVSIRRLTPMECERLQGFPDNWTKFGKCGESGFDKNGVIPQIIEISDTQRYKMCGNAVTVNVIKEIMLKLL